MTSQEKTQHQTSDDLTVFMLVKTMPEWLGMPVAERFAHFNSCMKPILKKYEGEVRCRIFNTEFFSTRVTDIWMWEVKSRHAYEMVVEELRETPLWDASSQSSRSSPAWRMRTRATITRMLSQPETDIERTR